MSRNYDADSKDLWKQTLRNGSPLAMAVCSAFLGAGIMIGHMQNKSHLPNFLYPPAIAACVSDSLMAVVSVLAFVFIRQSQGYHTKHLAKRPDELRKTPHVQKLLVRFLTIILGTASTVLSASYLYMLCFVLWDDKEDQYCFALTSQPSCADAVSGYALAFMILFLILTGCLNALLESQIRKVEERFRMKQAMHNRAHNQADRQMTSNSGDYSMGASGGGSRGNSFADDDTMLNSRRGDDDWDM